MRFSQDFIERVQESSNLVDIISQYTQLKPTGSGLMGRCPFPDHQERTASFSVSDAKQVYHCFGCHKSGNIFTFLRDYQGLSFPEAVEFLAGRANIQIPKSDNKDIEKEDLAKEKRKQMFRANKLAAQFFIEQLKRTGPEHSVKKYIEKRAMTPEILSDFFVGYAPREWDGLTNFLQSKGVPAQLAEEVRLIVSRKEGKTGHFDLFRDRLMFPILNSMGEVLAFGGRIIDQGEPKYLNSPETPVFTKGRVLYGLHQTARYIRSEDQAIIVEGYMDLIGLYQAGVKNVAATLGTALTADHAKILKRLTRNVLVLFDGDQAGQDAAERSLPLLLQADLYPKGLILPHGLDPDDYVKTYGVDALRVLMNESQDLFKVVLDSWMKDFKGEPADKVKLIDKVKPVLSVVPDPRLRDLYIGVLAERAGVSTQWLVQSLSLQKNSSTIKPVQTVKSPSVNGTNSAKSKEAEEAKISLKSAPDTESTMMALVLKTRANFETFLQENIFDFIRSEGVRSILQRALLVYRQEPDRFDRLTSLLVTFVDFPEKLFPSEKLMLEQINDGEIGDESRQIEEKLLKDAMKRVRLDYLEDKYKRVQEELKLDSSREKLEQLVNIQKDIHVLNKG
jgi:DNA primase